MTKARVKNSIHRSGHDTARLFAVFCAFLLPALSCLRADQVEMQNGDRYFGKVLSLTNDTLVLQSELLGKVTVPRAKVSAITLGTNFVAHSIPASAAATKSPATNIPGPAASLALTNPLPDLSALRKPGANSSTIQDIRQQMLTAAGPAAINRFDQMISGLMSGKLNLNDIRAEAKSAADQLRGFKRDLGDDAGGDVLDGYLDILDSFLKETASAGPIPNTTIKGAKATPESSSSGE